MENDELKRLQTALVGLHEIIQAHAELHLSNTKLLHQRMGMIETFLGSVHPEFKDGSDEVLNSFKDRIAKIESHQERAGARVAAMMRLLGE